MGYSTASTLVYTQTRDTQVSTTSSEYHASSPLSASSSCRYNSFNLGGCGSAAATFNNGQAHHPQLMQDDDSATQAAAVPRYVPRMQPPLLKQQQQQPIMALSAPSAASKPVPGGVNRAQRAVDLADQPAVPYIHSTSIIETMRTVLSDVDADDCEPNSENAFLVCDIKRVWDRYVLWQKQLGDRVEAFFAVKCNPDPVLLRMLARLGLGFDCASHAEISSVLSHGVHPEKIIYANPAKAASFIRHAAKAGVDMMTFDNADELSKVKKHHPNAKMVLRILTDDSGSLCKLGLKFGAPLSEVRGLLERAKQLDVDVVGISFHVGSGCTNPALFADAVERANWAFEIGAELGFNFELLDIGGGFGGDNFVEIAGILRPVLDKLFPVERGIRIIAEPGRYFVAEAFEMATNIIARRGKASASACASAAMAAKSPLSPIPASADVEEAEPMVMYYINDGVYGAFNCIMFDHQVVHPKVLTSHGEFTSPSSSLDAEDTEGEWKDEPCSVWGPTCDSIDCVSKLSYLPTARLQVGDWLRWENMGAYTICAASQVR